MWQCVFFAFLLYGTFGIEWLPAGLGRAAPLVEVTFLGLAAMAAWTRRDLAVGLVTAAWPVVLLLVWLVLTAAWSPLPEVTVTRASRLVIHFLTAVCLIATVPSVTAGFRVFAYALGIAALINVLAVPLVPGVAITEIGVRGFMASKNNAGQVAMVAILLAATLALVEDERRWRVAALGLLVAGLALLAVSLSKTSIGAVAMVAVAGPLVFWAARRGSAALVALFSALLAVLMIAILVVALAGWSGAEVALLLIGDSTVSQRDGIWSVIWSIFLANWAGGFGFGAFWDVQGMVSWIDRPIFFGDEGGVINQGHSGYLDLAMQAGLPGLILGLLVVARTAVQAIDWIMRARDRRGAMIAAGLFGVVLAFIVNNVTESTLFRQSGHVLHGVFIVTMLLVARARAS